MMAFLRYLYRSVNILNLILLLGLAAIMIFVVIPLFSAKVKVASPIVPPKAAIIEEEMGEEKAAPSPLDFAAISEENLFHPERRVPLDKKDEKALPKPELVLYGTIITDDMRVAYVEDKKSPKTTPGRGKRQSSAKIGDQFSGFVLKEIEADRIVLVRGDERMVVNLTEKNKQREGAGASGAAAATARPAPSATPVPGRTISPAPIAPVPAMPARPIPAIPTIPPARTNGQQQRFPALPVQKP